MEQYKKIKTVIRLSETVQDILYLINEFGILHNLKEEIRVPFVDNQLQKTEPTLAESFNFVFL